MRRRLAALPILLVAAACGQRFELPPETGGEILDPGYIVTRVWSNVPEPTDMALVEGVFYVAEESLRVVSYSTTSPEGKPSPNPLVSPFLNAGRPVYIAGARSEGSIYVQIADAESMAVKRYGFIGGDTLVSFRDPDWGNFAGISLATDLTTYVAFTKHDGSAYIRHYAADGTRIGTVSEDGTGRGFIKTPTSLYLANGFLYVTSSGNNWRVQKLDPNGQNAGLLEFPSVTDPDQLSTPRDVAADAGGFIYVADTGRARVLKFDAAGALEDSVYTRSMSEARVGAGLVSVPLEAPSSLIALEKIVYVGDPVTGRIVRFEVNE